MFLATVTAGYGRALMVRTESQGLETFLAEQLG